MIEYKCIESLSLRVYPLASRNRLIAESGGMDKIKRFIRRIIAHLTTEGLLSVEGIRSPKTYLFLLGAGVQIVLWAFPDLVVPISVWIRMGIAAFGVYLICAWPISLIIGKQAGIGRLLSGVVLIFVVSWISFMGGPYTLEKKNIAEQPHGPILQITADLLRGNLGLENVGQEAAFIKEFKILFDGHQLDNLSEITKQAADAGLKFWKEKELVVLNLERVWLGSNSRTLFYKNSTFDSVNDQIFLRFLDRIGLRILYCSPLNACKVLSCSGQRCNNQPLD